VSTEATELSAILSGTAEAPVIEAPPEPTAEPEKVEAAPAAVEKAPEDKPPPDHVPTKALQEERRKRQEYERELATVKQELETLKKPADAKVNLFEDPDGWEKTLDARVEAKLAAVRQESEQRFLVLVEQAAMARHTDFAEVAQVFAETAKSTPGLIDEARRAPDPAEFIYKAGLNLKRVQEAGSIDALIEKAREEGRQEALQGKSAPKIPESLTEIAGGKGESSERWSGPKPLNQLLPTY
jgi:hypothetical protein